MTTYLSSLKGDLIRDEGVVLSLYRCPAGFQTIGVGHNLDAKPISERAALVILEDDIADVIADLDLRLPWWRSLNEARQHVPSNTEFARRFVNHDLYREHAITKRKTDTGAFYYGVMTVLIRSG